MWTDLVPPAPEEHGELLLGAAGAATSAGADVVAVGLFGLLLGEEEVVAPRVLALAKREVVLVRVVAGTFTLKMKNYDDMKYVIKNVFRANGEYGEINS